MATARVKLPALDFGVAPVEIDLKGGGTMIMSKGRVDFMPKDGKNYVRRYTWAQLAKHLLAGGRQTWVPDSKAKEEMLSDKAKKAAKTRAKKKRVASVKAVPLPVPARKRA
ncbi:hypothetical protein [Ramlibacter sp. AN1133]|uniref:hypothetical protein n=1 Tax=Ramlibacter sp. AN1133 TaxID=3133429 RepID=UPI0030C390D1